MEHGAVSQSFLGAGHKVALLLIGDALPHLVRVHLITADGTDQGNILFLGLSSVPLRLDGGGLVCFVDLHLPDLEDGVPGGRRGHTVS